MDINAFMNRRAKKIEHEMLEYVKETDPQFGVIFDSMRYSLAAGGKRLRPMLTIEFAEIAALKNSFDTDYVKKAALPYACAVEMAHTYSLIHDDLPCMDNDDMRRGKPTNHKVYGEANALLAGDALLTKAFETILQNRRAGYQKNCEAALLLAKAVGASGMIGGQVLDLEGEKREFDFETVERLQSLKTGELIRCASLLGCMVGDANAEITEAAEEYSMCLGRAFQIVDDILDVEGDEKTLGKPVGSDAKSGKTTFLSFMSTDEAKAYAARLTDKAVNAIKPFSGSEVLIQIAESMLVRKK